MGSRKRCLGFLAASSTLTIFISLLYFTEPDRHLNVMELHSRTWVIPPMEGSTRNNGGFVLALNSADQSTGGAWNIMSLQCLMGQIDSGRVVVVEPFITEGVWGAHLSGDQQELARENNVRLSDIYDIREWESVSFSYGYARLARWEDFLLYAPRDLILVDFHWYSECSIPQLSKKLNPFIGLYNFSVVKTVCFDFVKSGVLSLDQFKEQLYGTYSPSSVSVIFSTFNGIEERPDSTHRYILNLRKCARGRRYDDFTKPSRRLLSDANRYIDRYLSRQTGYLSIMIRLEHVILHYGISNAEKTTKMCISHFTQSFQKVQSMKITNKVFFTMDFGKYGSSEFISGYRGNNTALEALLMEFFHSIFGQNLTFSKWEESFQNISGLTSGGFGPYVAGLQKVVASRGQCIILVGGGSFQDSALHLYKEDKKIENKDLCYVRLDTCCNHVETVLR